MTHITVAELAAWLATQPQHLTVQVGMNQEYQHGLDLSLVQRVQDEGQDYILLGESVDPWA